MSCSRVVIIHENLTRLHQAATLLKATSALRVIHTMRSVQECLLRLGNTNCDLILASVTLPKADLRELLKHLRQQESSVKVIVTDLPNDPNQILPWIAAGAAGYVLENEGLEAWSRQINAVCSGQPVVSPTMAAAMMGHLTKLSQLAASSTPNPSLYGSLTKREQEILALLSRGHTNQHIATQLILTIGTVKNHVHNLLSKLNLSNRKAASVYFAYVN